MVSLPQPAAGAREISGPRFDQVIVAGGDEDVAASDLVDWVRPLLPGIPGGRWQVCEIDFLPEGGLAVRYHSGAPGFPVSFTTQWAREDFERVASHMPRASSLALIVIEDCTGQMMTLLDSAATWLGVYDLGHWKLEPVARLLRHCAGVAVAS